MSNGGSSRRWCPAPEQLMVLEELYRRGLRTPNASQIQRITAHLSLYGSIQGKSVFYWFQNHKARHRHNKLRLLHHHFPLPFLHHQGSSGVMWQQTWRSPPASDPPKDWLMQTYGHDSAMINAGPAPNWWRSQHQQQPLQTLELFPLSSPTAADQQNRSAAS